MGTDINMVAERRNADGVWTPVGEPQAPDKFGARSVTLPEPYNRRNYALYAILADVRNDKNAPLKPIAMPRGVPDDMSPLVKEWTNRHIFTYSHSWLTVAELMAYDWSQIATVRGTAKTYSSLCQDFLANSLPSLREMGPPDDVRIVFFFNE